MRRAYRSVSEPYSELVKCISNLEEIACIGVERL